MRKALYIFLLLSFPVTVIAQDPHHSQYFNLPTFYNPAATGQGVEHIRATAVYRHQWPSLSSPFITQGLLFDKQVSRVGLGALLNSNSSGDAGIKRLQFGGMVSYRQKLGSHQLAAGIYTGLIQKSFDPSEMTFDDQYIDDAGYSAANPTSEYFAFTKVIRPDFGAGLLWTMGEEEKNRVQPFAGLSLLHINQPKEVFIEEGNSTAIKQTINAGAKITLSDFVDIKPSGLYAVQQSSVELMYGCLATLKFEDRNAAEAGIYMRQEESAIAYLGYRWNSLMAGLSYDLTTSNSISGPGAFELTLTYIPKAKPKKEKKAAPKAAVTAKKPVTKPAVSTVQETKPEIQKPASVTPSVQQKPVMNPAGGTAQEKKPETQKPVNTVPSAQQKPEVQKPAPVVKKPEPVSVKQPPASEIKKPQPAVQMGPAPELKKLEPATMAKKRTALKPVQVSKLQKPVQPQKDKITVTATQLTQQNRTIAVDEDAAVNPAVKEKLPALPVAAKPMQSQEEKPNGKIASFESEMKKATEVKKPEQKPAKSAPVKINAKAEAKPNMKPVAGDADKDGVPDKSDRCPDQPGLASENGCPSATAVIDIDGDGVPNNEDECPYIKGLPGTKGCPDTDGDGITDGADRCPMIKGSAENEGCPTADRYSDTDSFIKFEVNSVKINGFDVIDILEPVSDSLYIDPRATIVIAGHTDDEGNEYYNMILSQNRAEAVKAYFVKHGVASDKIHTIGYGETKPRESNETEYGRKLNRRAEIYILK